MIAVLCFKDTAAVRGDPAARRSGYAMQQGHPGYEIIARYQGHDPRPERLINRVIKPSFDTHGVSELGLEWTWDMWCPDSATELADALRRIGGVDVEVFIHAAEQAAA